MEETKMPILPSYGRVPGNTALFSKKILMSLV